MDKSTTDGDESSTESTNNTASSSQTRKFQKHSVKDSKKNKVDREEAVVTTCIAH